MKGGKKALPKIHFKALNAPRLSAEQLRMDLLLLIPSPGLRPERSPCPAGRPRAEHPRRQAGPAAGRPGRSPAARSRPARRRPPSAVLTGGEAVRRREGRAERPAGPGTGLPRGGQARRSHSPTSWSKGLVAKSGMAGRGGSARPPLRSRQRGDRTTGPRRLPLLLPPGSPSPPPPPPPRAPEPARRAQHAGKPGPALPPPGAARPAVLRRGSGGVEPRTGDALRALSADRTAPGPQPRRAAPRVSLLLPSGGAGACLPHTRPARWKSGLRGVLFGFIFS